MNREQDITAGGDFLSLLKERGHLAQAPPVRPAGEAEGFATTEGTTILALRFRDGVLVAGDRRATMGNTVVYDRADKVLSIDDCSVMALSGSPANAYEIARMLEISFQHYRRSQLQEMSLDGKLRTLSRLVRSKKKTVFGEYRRLQADITSWVTTRKLESVAATTDG